VNLFKKLRLSCQKPLPITIGYDSPAHYILQKKMCYKELKQTPGAVPTCGVNEANLNEPHTSASLSAYPSMKLKLGGWGGALM
jgi:hypothetical protein